MNDTYKELNAKLSRLQWLLHRHHMQTHAAHGPTADPTRGQGRVLAALRMQPEIATKDLSYLLGIRQQSLNELLNKLEKGGYVLREPLESDRRVMMVKLTDKGREEQPETRAEAPDIFQCLSQEEQESFGQSLDRIIAALEDQLKDDGREEFENWMRSARSRMGDEWFERFQSAWGGRHRGGPRWGGPDCRGRQPGGRHPHHHGQPYGRPEDMPGGDRFRPDYDGPLPYECEPSPGDPDEE